MHRERNGQLLRDARRPLICPRADRVTRSTMSNRDEMEFRPTLLPASAASVARTALTGLSGLDFLVGRRRVAEQGDAVQAAHPLGLAEQRLVLEAGAASGA